MQKRLMTISVLLGGIFFLTTTSTATPVPVTGFISEVTGKDMVGMNVTVEYGNNYSHTSTWTNLPGLNSGVEGPWGALYFGDDINTFVPNQWELTAEPEITINTLTIEGGKTVFDIIVGDGTDADKGTPGSELGAWEGHYPDDLSNPVTFGQSEIGGVTFDWTFSDVVYLAGTLPTEAIGDVYNTMRFDFTPNGGLTTYMHYKLDTDLVNPVPEPSTILLFGAGLVGVSALARRKKYKQQ